MMSKDVVTKCRSCGASIWWGITQAGKNCPFDVVDGNLTLTPHFATCPDARKWSKKRKAR